MNTTGDYEILFNVDKPKLRLHIKKKMSARSLYGPSKVIQLTSAGSLTQ
jgi:hypothetical protein